MRLCVSWLHVCMSVEAENRSMFFPFVYVCVCVRMCVRFLPAPEGGSATLRQTERTHSGLTSWQCVFGEIKQSVFIVRVGVLVD